MLRSLIPCTPPPQHNLPSRQWINSIDFHNGRCIFPVRRRPRTRNGLHLPRWKPRSRRISRSLRQATIAGDVECAPCIPAAHQTATRQNPIGLNQPFGQLD
jgi:hypothetical protein